MGHAIDRDLSLRLGPEARELRHRRAEVLVDAPPINQMLVQPFVNYNFAGGWYATSSPLITANWEASSNDRWTVPLGGGIGKIFKVGGQAMNGQVQAFYNVVSPDNVGGNWTIRVQLQFLFPK